MVSEEGTGHGWVQAPRARLLATPHRPVHPPPRPIWDATFTWHSGQKQPANGPREMSPARLGRRTGAHRGEGWGDLRPWAGGTPRQATPSEHVLGEGPSPWPQRPDTHQAPPECVRIGIKVIVLPLLCQVHQKRGQDEAEEANVPSSDQLLKEMATSQQPNWHPAQPAQEHRAPSGWRFAELWVPWASGAGMPPESRLQSPREPQAWADRRGSWFSSPSPSPG